MLVEFLVMFTVFFFTHTVTVHRVPGIIFRTFLFYANTVASIFIKFVIFGITRFLFTSTFTGIIVHNEVFVTVL